MSLTRHAKNVINFVFRLGLSGLLLWYLFSRIDLKDTREVLLAADLKFIVLAGLIFFSINIILLWRWKVFLRAVNVQAPVSKVTRYFFIGLFGNLFLPSSIGGDFIKIWGLCRNSTQKPAVVASVILDRLSGFAAIVIVSVFSFVIGFQFVKGTNIIFLILAMAAGSILFAGVLFNEKMYGFCCGVFNRFPKVKEAVMQMHYDVVLLKNHKRDGWIALAVSCVCHVLLAICWYVIALGLNQDVSLIHFLIFVPITCVAASLPSIGGLGVREAGAAYLFAKVGMASGVAVSISLINFLFMVLVGLIGGAVYVFTFSSGRVQHHPSDADGESLPAS